MTCRFSLMPQYMFRKVKLLNTGDDELLSRRQIVADEKENAPGCSGQGFEVGRGREPPTEELCKLIRLPALH